MEFEILKKSHKKEILTGAVVFILITIVLIVRASFAKYQTTKNVIIAEGTVNYKVPDFKIMAMYKNDGNGDVEITTMPEEGYEINKERSYCTTDNVNKVYNKVFTNEEGKHVITGLSKDSKCYIYFDKKVTAGETILGNSTVNEGTPDFGKTSCTSGCSESTVGLYSTKDDDGVTYYFRGDVTNNYVKFANKFWRIIRINGDGTIRLIYQGTSATSTGTNAQIGTSAFNTSYNDNMYVGFKYTSGQVHGTGTESKILQSLNNWHTENLKNHIDKIDTNAGFCGDRTPSTSSYSTDNLGGTGSTITYYKGYLKYVYSEKLPTLICPTEDLYTLTGATKGNKSLTYPIGLITADEVSMAGGVYGTTSSNYYLYTGQAYWTITPWGFDSLGARILRVTENGSFYYNGLLNSTYGVRPVINIRSDVTLTGTGTASDPYVVVGGNS